MFCTGWFVIFLPCPNVVAWLHVMRTVGGKQLMKRKTRKKQTPRRWRRKRIGKYWHNVMSVFSPLFLFLKLAMCVVWVRELWKSHYLRTVISFLYVLCSSTWRRWLDTSYKGKTYLQKDAKVSVTHPVVTHLPLLLVAPDKLKIGPNLSTHSNVSYVSYVQVDKPTTATWEAVPNAQDHSHNYSNPYSSSSNNNGNYGSGAYSGARYLRPDTFQH